MSPRIGSLCTGTGALDMAVMDVLGGSMAWHCQYEPPDKHGREDKHQYAARILAHHWPDVPNHGDLTTVDWNAVEPVDIVTAGFPCTDLSYAGLGAGIKEGTRSGLWLTIARAIRTLRPRLVVLENVRAIVNRRPGLDVVLADLARLGFNAEWLCVPASDVGAPHERYRWFLLAWPANAQGTGWERTDSQRGRASGDDRGAATDTADLGHERGRPARDRRTGPADRRLAAADADLCGLRTDERDVRAGQPDADRRAPADPGGDRRDLGPNTPRREPLGRDAADRGRVPSVEWGSYGPAVARWERILGRPAPRPVDDRGRLAPVFVEWVMGLPEGHVCDVPPAPGMTAAGLRNARLKALGNGVVRQQAVYALRLLLARLDLEVAA
ncbi:DNA cytosine methyltransferase [Streptosporangium canum]|uniref:DNA cytosine methyltransferase n=1 Tax=Streptosporangium canum TaxID=324952 RepID=UPI0037B36C12